MHKFNTLAAAERFREKSTCYSGLQILSGDDGLYWVCSNRQALKLIREGYWLA